MDIFAVGSGPVAQSGQSGGLLIRRPRVQFPSGPPHQHRVLHRVEEVSRALKNGNFTCLFDWTAISGKSLVEWLLEKENPSVRYFTLREILDRAENDPEVEAARRAIPKSPVATKIFAKQSPEGNWEDADSPYLPKYKASYWQIMMLGQLGLDKNDQRVKRACEHVFRFQSEEGGFSSCSRQQALHEHAQMTRRGKALPSPNAYADAKFREHQYSCLTGNVASALTQLGYGDDPRVRKAFTWLTHIQNSDGGWLCPYWRAHARDRHGCFYGTICALEAFSTVDKQNMSAEMRKTVARAAEFMLMHRLFKADHHGYAVINNNWLMLSFPTFYGYNFLRGLDVLTQLGYTRDERLTDAVEALMQKRLSSGRWVLENSPVGRMHANLEVKGKPSKWITLIALRTLKRICNV